MATKQLNKLIYLVMSDANIAAELIADLEKAHYLVRHFVESNEIDSACEKKHPAAIIIESNIRNGEVTGIDVAHRLKDKFDNSPPLIFVSDHNDMQMRLAAANAGVRYYFSKPLDSRKLIQTLEVLCADWVNKPYRILIIDDDQIMLDFYASVLGKAGMEVTTLNNPLEGLQVLDDVKPDVVVMDVYMPGCTGPELARVIRQDDEWALMPIMFLSSEDDLNQQLAAIKHGGDDFLVKPIDTQYLVSVVTARAKRARLVNRLNTNLKSTLRENEYQLITMDKHVIVSVADITGRITSVNDKFCEISGYSHEELVGQNHRILKSAYHTRSFYEDLWKTISAGKVWRGTICNHKKSGEEYWVESTIVPFLDEQGKPYKFVSARTDITALRQSEERQIRGQKFANIGTWDWNIKSGDLFWSERIGPLFGYEKDVPETNYDNFLAAVHPEDKDTVISAINNCVNKGDKYDLEHRVVWPDGSVHWMHESGDVIRSETGEALHMLGVVRNIDDRKNSELALIIAREEAEKANLAKSEFLSSMSHELRTPMNAIMGFSQLLQVDTKDPLNEYQLDNVNEVIKASSHLLELINEVLDLAKIEAGRIDLSFESVVLSEIIADSLPLITSLANQRGIEITLTWNYEKINLRQLMQHSLMVRADRTRFKQVLINLLSNAVKYNSENGDIIIACNKIDNNRMRISISDTGEGLTQEQQEKLFMPFNRMSSEKKYIEGTGIGLVITKNIVELMGGSIGVDSKPGEGSTFWVELSAESLFPEKTRLSMKSDSVEQQVNVRQDQEYTVLYIEDNPANMRLVVELLSLRPNIKVLSAHEPKLGMDMVAEYQPDLILLDINLPGMSGIEVLKQLRQRETSRDTPIIAISANAMTRDIEKGMDAGFDDYITKPIDVTALLHAVDLRLAACNK